MVAPGWYHADGDPAGTKRYWDGTTWVGDATADAATGDVIYYAAPESEIDLGDVARRVSLSEQKPKPVYASSPYSVSSGSVNVARRRPIPEGLKNLTILVCVFKSIPLLLLGISIVLTFGATASRAVGDERYQPPGLALAGEQGATLGLMILVFAIGASLVFVQGRSSLRDDPSMLFSVALIMVLIDLLTAANEWLRSPPGASVYPTLAVTFVLALQVVVAAWAGMLTRRKT